MADLGEEADEYDSDPEQAKLSLTMRRRIASDDEEDEEDDDDDNVVSDARVRVRVSDYESDGQGAAAEYDDDDVEEELELVDDEEDEGVVGTVVIRSVDRFDNNNNNRSGGVEEGEGEGRQEEKKENEPFAVPTAGAFYMHDDRFRDGGRGRGRGRNRRTFGGRKLLELRDERKWGHDKFEEVTTQDRRYHEHRRGFRGRNRGRGRHLGEGRGFSRNYNNNNNNNQTTGPKSIRGRGPRRYQPSTQNTFVQPPAQSRQHAKPMEKTSHASSGRATASSATSASAHGFVRKNVVASSLNSASLPFYPSGSSNNESKSGSVTRGPRPPAMSENYPVSQSNISQGRNVSVSLSMDKLYIDDPISKPMNSQTRAHGRGPVSFGQVGHQSVPFSQQFRARSASGPQAFSPPKTSGSARGLESVDMESSTESNDFRAVLGLRGKGSTPSSGTGSFSYGDQNFSGAPRFLPVMQFAGQHPRGLGVPAVGMAFPGYVGQPDGLGNSEMTWLPVLAGAAGALGAAGLNAPYHPYITMDGAYNARPSGQLASLAHPINKDSNMNKSSSEVKPYQKPEIEKDELRQRQNKARRQV
ncbi:protein MLN51 homolog [Bidens hawaiensis]|uniref:protein MLN51 homolog n=1 Tax=Bidens hawaiensis TaxID=980011 RepID=UPI00404A1409